MTEVSVTEAKAGLSELLKRAQAGESFIITRRGRPVARISAPEKRPLTSRADVREKLGRTGGEQPARGTHQDARRVPILEP